MSTNVMIVCDTLLGIVSKPFKLFFIALKLPLQKNGSEEEG